MCWEYYENKKNNPQITQKEIKEVKQSELSCAAGGSVNWYSHCENILELPGKAEDMHTLSPRSSTQLVGGPGGAHTRGCHEVAKHRSLPKCPPAVGWMKQLGFYTANEKKRNAFHLLTTTWLISESCGGTRSYKLLENLSYGTTRIGPSRREGLWSGRDAQGLLAAGSVLFPDPDGGSMVAEKFICLIIICKTIPWYFTPPTLYIIVHFFL